MKQGIHILLAFFLAACSTLLAADEASRPPLENHAAAIRYLSGFIEEQRDEHDIPGLSVALVDGREIVWQKGFGQADVEKNIPATADTLYRNGAVSTLLTATLIMRLAEAGRLSLDDPLTKYLPQFSIQRRQDSSPVRIRDLLSHHAGLPLSRFKGMWADSPASLDQLLIQIKNMHASYPVGQVYAYSNLGYDLLGKVVEEVTGAPFQLAMKKLVLNPLGMKASGFALFQQHGRAVAAGYKGGDRKKLLKMRDVPALGLYSSVREMAYFAQAAMKASPDADKVMSTASWRSMLNQQNRHVSLDLGKAVGFGWQLKSQPGAGLLAWRQGASLLHRSRISLLPEQKLAVVVMANSSKAFRAVEMISREALQVMLEVRRGIRTMPLAKVALSAPPGKPSVFQPSYSSFLGLLTLKGPQPNLQVDLMGWDVALKPAGNGWYKLEYELFGFITVKLDWVAEVRIAPARVNGKDVVMVHYQGVNYLFASALSAPRISPAWARRIGTYKAAQRDVLLDHYKIKQGRLKIHDHFLVFEYDVPFWLPVTLRLPVQPLNDHQAVIPGIGTGLNETVEVQRSGGREYLQYSGYTLQRQKVEQNFFF